MECVFFIISYDGKYMENICNIKNFLKKNCYAGTVGNLPSL
jgi:hypothetical protein